MLLLRLSELVCLIVKLIQNINDNILRIEPIQTSGPLSLLINKDNARVGPNLEMLPTEIWPIFLAVELVEFEVGADFVGIFIVVEVGFYVAAVLAPGREEFYYFYGCLVFDCWEHGFGV